MHDVVNAIWTTVIIYLPAWIAGVFIALFLSAFTWFIGHRISRFAYLLCAGISFIPVTILLPYFLRIFGLNLFVYPLLAMPVTLVMYASFHEAFEHSNKARTSLITNYSMTKARYFRFVLLRESIPSVHTSLRFTLSLSFAIFIALDYFIEFWGGLGSLVRFHYNRIGFDYQHHNLLMAWTVASAGLLGSIQVVVLSLSIKPFTEFRKHY